LLGILVLAHDLQKNFNINRNQTRLNNELNGILGGGGGKKLKFFWVVLKNQKAFFFKIYIYFF